MDEVVWRQHPSVCLRIGGLAVSSVLALAVASGFVWLPWVASGGDPELDRGLAALAPYLPLALLWPLTRWCAAWLGTRWIRYDLTSERLLISSGWLSARVDSLELYRVREMHLVLPLLPRLCGVGNLVLRTIDHDEPEVVLRGVRDPHALLDRLRTLVEACRRKTGIAGMS